MDKNILKVLMIVPLIMLGGYSMADTASVVNSPSASFLRNNIDGSQTLLGHMPPDVATSKLHHHADSNEQLDIRIMVPLANQSELDGVLKGLYDPTSPIYHHFLTSDQFSQQFKASDADLAKIKNYLSSKGFSVNSQSANGSVLSVTGSVNAVEKAFKVHINYYTKGDGTMFRAPDTDPTVDTEIAGTVSAVAGLDNLAPFKPHLHQLNINQPAQTLGQGQVAAPHMMGTGPGGYLAPADVLKAYNLNAIPAINDPSSLQNVALFELDGYLQSDIATYEAYFHLPNNNSVMLQNVLIDGFNGSPTSSGGSDEVTLDVEELIGIANASINKIYVYETSNTWQGWIDEWTKIAKDNIAKNISCSWGIAESYSPELSFDRGIFQQMAAQGQEVFVASGDCGAYSDCSTKTLLTNEPASQAYVTGVGISALSVNSDGSYKSETASVYGGGGISIANYVINGVSTPNSLPSYQQPMASQATKASMVSQTMRNVPDVSLTADASTAYAFYITDPQAGPGWYGFYGSSIAAPTWAAFLAQVNQGKVHTGQAIVGFLNPVLYSLANSSKFSTDFHDITTGTNQYYPAQAGFDDATGLGSFNGANLYNDLVAPAKVVAPSAPTGVSALGGTNQVSLSWSLSIGAASYNVERSTVSGGSYQIINSSPIVGTSYVDSSVAVGTPYYYVITAVNTAGTSPISAQVSATPLPTAPAEPTGLQALPGNNQVTFSWNATAGATSYNVRRSNVSGSMWTILANVTTTSYVDKTAINGMTYYYTVSAVNAGGESPYINQFVITLPPNAPVGVSAVPGNNQVALSWNASANAVSYNVKRAANSGGPYSTISTSGAVTVNGYTDLTAKNGTTYYYVVSAVNAGGEGANSSQVTAMPVAQVPVAPTGLVGVSGNKTVTLSWNAVAGATSYNVQRSTVSNASFTTIATVNSPGFTDSAVSNGYGYYYEINAVNANGQGPNTSEIYVIPAGLPIPPTTVTAVAGNAQATVTFSGQQANGSVMTGYTVTSSPGSITATGTSSPITVSGLTNGTAYTFTVKVTNGVGTGAASAPSNSVTPLSPAPSAPTGLQGAGGNNQVALSWNASTGAVSYNVKRSLSNGSYVTIAVVTSPSYTDKTVVNWTTYFYVVTAVNASGAESANSNMSEVVPYAPLAAPGGFTAVSGSGGVSLSWNSISGTEFYYIYRSTASTGPFNFIASSVSNSYTDASVVSGGTYYYEVAAYEMINGTGFFSQNTAPVKATYAPAPSAPASLSATPGNNQVTLAWSASTGATSYNVKRSTSANGPFTVLMSLVAGTTYLDATAKNGTAYYYVVSAVNASGESPNSNPLMVTPLAPPSAPSGLTAVASSGAVMLSWTAVPESIYYYIIGRSTVSGGPYTSLVATTGTSFKDSSVVNGNTYYYVVSVYANVNGIGFLSPNSAQVMAKPALAVPAAPTGLSAISGNNQAALTWSAVSGATSYNVKRSTVSGGPYTAVSTSGAVTNSNYTDKTTANGTTYYYVVSAVNASGESANSAQVIATPVPPAPAAPSGLTATTSAGQVMLAWSASSGASSYTIERLSDWNVGFVTIATGITVPQYTDKNSLVDGTTYYYQVIAVNAGGQSGLSNYVTAVATLTGNYTFPLYISGSGKVQYSYVSNGKTVSGSFSSNGSITVPSGTVVSITSTANSGHKYIEDYIPFNNIGYTTNSTVSFNVTGNNYIDAMFQ